MTEKIKCGSCGGTDNIYDKERNEIVCKICGVVADKEMFSKETEEDEVNY